MKNGTGNEKNTGKVREICQSDDVWTLTVLQTVDWFSEV